MKIIDSHIHSSFSDMFFKKGVVESGVIYSRTGLISEMDKNKISFSISMQIETGDGNFNNNTGILKEFSTISNVCDILAVNPYDGLIKNRKNLKKYEDILEKGKIKGLKIYLGYYPFFAYDVFVPVLHQPLPLDGLLQHVGLHHGLVLF